MANNRKTNRRHSRRRPAFLRTAVPVAKRFTLAALSQILTAVIQALVARYLHLP